MKREEYIKYRNENSPIPLYEFYKEHHKGGIMLTIDEFFHFLGAWPHWQEVYQNLFKYLDVKFEVNRLEIVKTGQIIKYY